MGNRIQSPSRIFQRTSVSVEPLEEPVTLAEVKEHLRRFDDDENVLLTSYIVAARYAIENFTGRKLIEQTLVAFMDEFPVTRRGSAPWWGGTRIGTERSLGLTGDEAIRLKFLPLLSVEELLTISVADVETVFDAAGYIVDAASKDLHGRIVLREGSAWPSSLRRANAVKITYKAGYGDSSAVPQALKHIIYTLVAHFCKHREAVGEPKLAKVPLLYEHLLAPYVVPGLG